MRRTECIGIVSSGCSKCNELKSRLEKDFHSMGVEIEFIEYVYEIDSAAAVETAEKFGLDDIPSFYVAGEVFRGDYGKTELERANGNIH